MRAIICLLAFFSLGAIPSSALIPQEKSKEELAKGQVVEGNYIQIGEALELAGIVTGNSYLIGTQVVVTGEVQGNLYVIGGNVIINGKIGGDLRVLSGEIFLDGSVGGSIGLLGASIGSAPSWVAEQGVFLAGGYAQIDGLIKGRLVAFAGGLQIMGKVLKNVRAFIGRLWIAPHAHLADGLKYRSTYPAEIDPTAQIDGQVIYNPSRLRSIMDATVIEGVLLGSKVIGFLMNFLYSFTVGWLLLRFFPKKMGNTLRTLQSNAGKSFLCGFLCLFLLPLISVVLFITVIGTPFALTLMAINIISFYSAKEFSILWAANALFSRFHGPTNRTITLFTGQVLYHLLTYIPLIGWLISLAAMVFGLGSTILTQIRNKSSN